MCYIYGILCDFDLMSKECFKMMMLLYYELVMDLVDVVFDVNNLEFC